MSLSNENLNIPANIEEQENDNEEELIDTEDTESMGSEIEKVEEQIDEIFNSPKAEPDKKKALAHLMIQTRRTVHSGPLPDGETLEAYNRSIPEGGHRVMIMAENQQKHRHEIEKLALNSKCKQSTTGQWMGFTIALLFLVAAVWLILHDHEGAGITIITIDLISLVAIFVSGKYYSKSG